MDKQLLRQMQWTSNQNLQYIFNTAFLKNEFKNESEGKKSITLLENALKCILLYYILFVKTN